MSAKFFTNESDNSVFNKFKGIIENMNNLYALSGMGGEAVKWSRETAKTGFSCYPLFERDPYLNRIRQVPEFIQFTTEMKTQNEEYEREFK